MSASQYLLVRNRGRDPLTRTLRAARPGMRRTGFLFGDGRRIRRAGGRFTQLELAYCKAQAAKLLEGVEFGFIEVADDQGKVMDLAAVRAVLGGAASKKAAPEPKPEPPKAPEPPKVEEPEAKVEPPAEPKAEEPKTEKSSKKRRTK